MTTKKESKPYFITEEVLSRIRETVGSQIPETGGILGSSDGKHIDYFYFDKTANVTGATYEPDCNELNPVIRKWHEEGIEFVGFIHSHPRGAVKPSDPDNLYTTKIMKAFEMEWFVSLIVQVHRSLKGEKAKLFAYGYYLADPCCYFEFGRIDEKNPSFEFPAINLEEDQDRSYREMLAKKYPFSKEELNRRNKELFPEDVLTRKTLVVFGTGGSIGFVLDMARSGVTNFILVDGDKFEPHNMSNQRVTYDDIGKSKVEALKERILNINMDAEVKTFDEFIDDTVTDEDFERLIGDQLLTSPKDVLICACTDSFEAQARLAALAMKYGTPFMAPQIYAGGVGAEIVFSYPGVTPSCPRCVLKSRYDAYKNGYKNTVTSECTPISAITHANALEGQIALMLLLYHEGDNRYAEVFGMERINLSVLSGASHDGMLQLKSNVDMTGSDQQHQSYDYECLFPETCNPREICLSFIKSADKYIFRVNPHFRYDGGNSVMGILADTGAVSFSSWQDAEQALRSLSEEGTKPTISNATPDTLTDWNEISVPEASESKTPSFEHLKERLQKTVIGQDDSTEAVAYIVAQHLAKKNPTKPVSILASGPPGVGKSETAKALAKILSQDCGQEYAVSWTDLNNFTEAFSVYRLIGAPAGYVGYEDEAVFEVVERNPYTIFIFDELDKAHPEVLKTFMAILDEGRCASRKTLSDGSREFDFKHCIFFFTSNYDLSSNQPAKRKIGFAVSDDVEDICLKENEISVSYRDEQASSISDESLPMRIYRENEAARKAFVGVGVLREIASRFQCFVNFKPLSAKAKIRILAKQIIEMGFEYSHAISYIAPGIMQGLIDAAMSGDSLTVRSFKSVIEGYLAPVFARAEVIENRTYRLEGTLEEPQMIPAD